MIKMFNKKDKPSSFKTVQEGKVAYNSVMSSLIDKVRVQRYLAMQGKAIEKEINELHQQADSIAQKVNELTQLAKEELNNASQPQGAGASASKA